ncbi:MAG: L-histidine N(alpha)-methyltransferase [Bdellovibrionaceae bacterium]|nr:L-histidine N(alpha)-methyltransferase [Pseudobdellovibrionaceae bacterium]
MAVFWDSPGTLTESRTTPHEAREFEDLREALEGSPKRIPSKYFYDDRGSEIFSRIMETPEYYPTRAETEILVQRSDRLLVVGGLSGPVHVVELGAGDGRKTAHFLRAVQRYSAHLRYTPVDISAGALRELSQRIKKEFADIEVEPRVLDFESKLESLPLSRSRTNMVLLLGSSIGNWLPEEQSRFLRRLRAVLSSHDFLLIGFDLKKEASILIAAYNDALGWTREFNLNLLERLNRDVGANFVIDQFRHHASYNPATGAMESWLIAQRALTVSLRRLNFSIHLKAFEGIHVETSWKYLPSEIEQLAHDHGFRCIAHRYDRLHRFRVDLWS